MMNLSVKDLEKVLAANPDISLDGPIVPESPQPGGKPAKMSEFEMQTKVFDACNMYALVNRDWQMVAAVPNGQYRPGQRMEAGLRPGFPDIIVPLARHSRIGLAIECKVGSNKPTAEQLRWHRELRLENWVVEVIYDDPQEAIDLIRWYLEG